MYPYTLTLTLALVASAVTLHAAEASPGTRPTAAKDQVFQEKDGVVFIEAEQFRAQSLSDKRAWHITSAQATPEIDADGDPVHLDGASSGAYVELLPDTRRTHGDKLINGENFINEGGKMAVLSYKVQIKTPGRYYVWARVYSTTSEDNGLHFGLDSAWPASGARWQTTQKHGWHWDCRQRTTKVHTGVLLQLWLDIETAGEHDLLMSMREDGTEVDRIALARDIEWRPDGFRDNASRRPGTKVKNGDVSSTVPTPAKDQPRGDSGDGSVAMSGDLAQWHKVTLTLDGPFARESDNDPNPFTDYRMTVRFRHESGSPEYRVPGYFAADGNAAETSADAGVKWRAHLSPDKPGKWSYTVAFVQGKHAAFDPKAGKPVAGFDGKTGSFEVAKTDKTGRDFRAKGRLEYVGGHYLRFAGTGEYFLKAGPDAPETLLGYADFDGTVARKKNVPLKTWQPHVRDWTPGDPTWKDGQGKGLIGAVNYLAGKGCTTFSFMPYNAGGDGDNVWPFVARDDKFHYDCSKLDQWGIVFDHAQANGLYLHFKLQEQENDDNRVGSKANKGEVASALDGGDLGPERMLYCRELIARYGHELALNWNLGEENTQSTAQQIAMAGFIQDTDPYHHNIVVHTFPNRQDAIYPPLLGKDSPFTGASLQNSWDATHQRTLKWVTESEKAGKPWVVANDEQNPAGLGVPPDKGYQGHDGVAVAKGGKKKRYTSADVRKLTLWGNLMAGGAGVEYYFGYQLPQNDLLCEDFRSRDKSWDFCRIALNFFRDNNVPFWEMTNADALVGNPTNSNARYCLARPNEVYLVYLPDGGKCDLDLGTESGTYRVDWFDPRSGGDLKAGSVRELTGPGSKPLGTPPADPEDDWVVLVRKTR